MKPVGLLIGFIIIAQSCFSQNMVLIDSLRRNLTHEKNVRNFDILNAIGFEFRNSHPDSTIYYCQQAYALGKEMNVPHDLARPLSFIGLAAAYKGDYNTALNYHQQAIQVSNEQNDTIEIAYAHNNLARMFIDEGDYRRAYSNLIPAHQLFQKINDNVGLSYIFRTYAELYRAQGEWEKALDAARMAYQLRADQGLSRGLISALLELGRAYQSTNDFDNAILFMNQADSVASIMEDQISHEEINIGLAEIYATQGEIKLANTLATEVLNGVTEETNQKIFIRAMYIQALYLHSIKSYDKSIVLLNKIMGEAIDGGNLSFQRDAVLLLSKIYEEQNDLRKALALRDNYHSLKSQLESDEVSRSIEKLEFQIEMEKKEKENEQLKVSEAQSKAILAQKEFQNNLLVIIISFTALLALVFWINSKRRRDVNAKLNDQNQYINQQRTEIAKQNDDLVQRNAQLSEINSEKDTLMNIVAHDLKAPLARIEGLTNLIELEGVQQQQRQEYIDLLKASTRSGLNLITDLLDVNMLEDKNRIVTYSSIVVSKFFNELLDPFRHQASAKSIEIVRDYTDSDAEVTTIPSYLSRIVENLVSNSIKFSYPKSSVWVGFHVVEQNLVLTIKDQGPGFTSQDKNHLFQKFKKLSARPTAGESSNGLGLAIVKILVDRLKGTIDLISEGGRGAKFIVQIPVEVKARQVTH